MRIADDQRKYFAITDATFVAAAKESGSFLQSSSGSRTEFASQEGFKFMFSPAYAPHFGGIWEAGVKSAKQHVKRVMGNTNLTFEELTTLFAIFDFVRKSEKSLRQTNRKRSRISV